VTLGPNSRPGLLKVDAVAWVDGKRAQASVDVFIEPTEAPISLQLVSGDTLELSDGSALQHYGRTTQPIVWLQPEVRYSWAPDSGIFINRSEATYAVTGTAGIVRLGVNGEVVGIRTGSTSLTVSFGALSTAVDVTVECRGAGGVCTPLASR
jgi:hypothetical protein